MTRFLSIITLSIFSTVAIAQHHHHDFSEPDMMLNENLKKAHPEFAEDITKAENHLEKFTADFIQHQQHNASRAADYDYIIPVVFHILHEDGDENITNKEVYDAMRILNEDFKLENEDQTTTVPAFQSRMGDARIEFRLARKDPSGNPTNGIDRIRTSLTNNAGEGSKLNPWPRDTYMNIWIVKSIGSGAAGYTFLPSGAHRMPTRDGIILLYTYFSSVRTGTARRSRALTHEVGHWLNLPHPWGRTNNPGLASNCNDDDGVFDTPNTEGWTSCNLNGTTCGSLDNVQNFMDYSYCATMFTKGQVSRMQAALNTWVAQRNSLVSKTNNEKAGVLDLSFADFESDKRVICTNGSINFRDISIYGADSWSWEFEGGTPETSTERNPTVTYKFPGSYQVKLTVTNGTQTKTKIASAYVQVNRSVGNFLPVLEDFESSTEAISNNWVPENEDNDNIYWQISEGGVAPSGTKYLSVRNYDNLKGMVESVISPAIDMSNIINPQLTFEVATAERNPSAADGIFKVYASTDCGQTWVTKLATNLEVLANGKSVAGSFIPTSKGDWFTQTITKFDASDKVENLLLKFELENGNGNNVYIDNINLYGTFLMEPGLEFPRNGMDSVSTDIFLDWKAVPFVDKYEVQLSTNAGFSSTIKSEQIDYISEDPNGHDTRLKAEALSPNTKYFWRVRTIFGSTTSNWSDVWSFTTSASGVGHEFLDGEEFVSGVELSSTDPISVRLFPNPAKDRLNIQVLNTNKAASVSIVNLYGAEVLNKQFENSNALNSISLEGFAKGFYMVNVAVEGTTSTNKILIQ